MLAVLPILAVAILEEALLLSDLLRAFAYVCGVSFGISIVVLFPLALLGETLVKRYRHTVWILPGCLGLGAVTMLVVRTIALDSFLDAVRSWSGVIAIIATVFVLYWTALWIEKAVLIGWHRLVAHYATRQVG
jgi:hypothetical protein